MTGRQVRIRDAMYQAILKDRPSYVIPDFDLEQTYYPSADLEDITRRPKVKLVATGLDSARNRMLRDAKALLLDVSIQVLVQHKVDVFNLQLIDDVVLLSEQIMNTCEDDDLCSESGYHYTWASTDMLRDENGLVYSYETLTVNGVFQSIFNVRYQHIKEL